MERWICHKDYSYYLTFSYAHMNKIWLKIVWHGLILGKNMIDVTRDQIFLAYSLMHNEFEINVGL